MYIEGREIPIKAGAAYFLYRKNRAGNDTIPIKRRIVSMGEPPIKPPEI